MIGKGTTVKGTTVKGTTVKGTTVKGTTTTIKAYFDIGIYASP